MTDKKKPPRGLLGLSGATPPNGLLGFPIRGQLYPGEESFFKSNPNVAGMAAEDNSIILNPYSPPGVNRAAVAKNEALRLAMKANQIRPAFSITPEQTAWFGQHAPSYLSNPQAMRESMMGRLYSNDSPYSATDEQRAMLGAVLNMVNKKRKK